MSSVPDVSHAHYAPPWADVSIIGIAGSSGSGKTSLSKAIVSALDLPWVVILSMDSFYKTLDADQHAKAHQNEWDFDSPEAIDFDVLVDRLRKLKEGKRAEIPIYSFAKHQREQETTSIYSPHVLILEGIFALFEPRVVEMLDLGIFTAEDADVCLSRRILRDVAERGRDIQGCIKQWFTYVKPNFETYVDPQKKIADIIVPRGVENRVAIDMVTQYIERKLAEKSKAHRLRLRDLAALPSESLLDRVLLLRQTPQLKGISTILQNTATQPEDFIFYFDRMATLLVEQYGNPSQARTMHPVDTFSAMNHVQFRAVTITTSAQHKYMGLLPAGETSAVIILRAGAAFETGLKRVIPDCRTGRILIQSNTRTGEPELHYLKLPDNIRKHESVLLMDPQMSSGGAALMAVQILVDHGVEQNRIVFVTYFAGTMGLNRLTKAFPNVTVVVCAIVQDFEERWVEKRYFGC